MLLLQLANIQGGCPFVFVLLNRLQLESLGCLVVVSQDHAVYLTAKHAKCWGSPRLQKLIDVPMVKQGNHTNHTRQVLDSCNN